MPCAHASCSHATIRAAMHQHSCYQHATAKGCVMQPTFALRPQSSSQIPTQPGPPQSRRTCSSRSPHPCLAAGQASALPSHQMSEPTGRPSVRPACGCSPSKSILRPPRSSHTHVSVLGCDPLPQPQCVAILLAVIVTCLSPRLLRGSWQWCPQVQGRTCRTHTHTAAAPVCRLLCRQH